MSRSDKSVTLKPRWPSNAEYWFDRTVPLSAHDRSHVARRNLSTCLADWRDAAARHHLNWTRTFEVACEMAAAVDCQFDAEAGKWVGRGCLVGAGVADHAKGARVRPDAAEHRKPGALCSKPDEGTNMTKPLDSGTRAGVPVTAALQPAFQMWRARVQKEIRRGDNSSRCGAPGHLAQRRACAEPGKGRPWWASTLSLPRVTVLTMIKDAANMIRDWVSYHLLIGVHHFYIVVNDCGSSAETYRGCGVLKPYIDAGVVTLEDELFRCKPVSRTQVIAAAMTELSQRALADDWLLGIDPDEYVVLAGRERLGSFVKSLAADNVDSISLPWKVYGTSFRKIPPTKGTVIANYRQRLWLDGPFAATMQLLELQRKKTQINPFLAKEAVRSIALRNDSRCAERTLAAHTFRCKKSQTWLPRLRGTLLEQASGFRAKQARGWINHYTYLSESEWEKKKLRGRPRFGEGYTRRFGSVNDLFSVQYDDSARAYVRAVASTAPQWSSHPIRAQRCAVSLQSTDDHFDHGLPQKRAGEVAATAVQQQDDVKLSRFINHSVLRRADANASRIQVAAALQAVYEQIVRSTRMTDAVATIPQEQMRLISSCRWHDVACSGHYFMKKIASALHASS